MRPQPLLRAKRRIAVGALGFATLAAGASAVAEAQNQDVITIKSAECTGCMHCIASCPAEGALLMSAPAKRRVPAWALAGAMTLIFVGVYFGARATGHWQTLISPHVYGRLVPHANEFAHP